MRVRTPPPALPITNPFTAAVRRTLLLLGILDSLLAGLWVVLRPGDLFTFLCIEPREPLLVRLMGVLLLAHAVVLLFVLWRPGEHGALLLVPMSGRGLAGGVWLWCLAAPQLSLPADRLWLLLVHDAVWLPVFALIWTGSRRSS